GLARRRGREAAPERLGILAADRGGAHHAGAAGRVDLLLEPPALEVLRRAALAHTGLGDREAQQPLAVVRAPEAQKALIVGQEMAGGGEIQRAALGIRGRRHMGKQYQRHQHHGDGAAGTNRHGRSLIHGFPIGHDLYADYNAKKAHVKRELIITSAEQVTGDVKTRVFPISRLMSRILCLASHVSRLYLRRASIALLISCPSAHSARAVSSSSSSRGTGMGCPWGSIETRLK